MSQLNNRNKNLVNCGKAGVLGSVPGMQSRWTNGGTGREKDQGWMWRVSRRLGGEVMGVGSCSCFGWEVRWERLGVDDIALVLQKNMLRWYGHVLRKADDDWVKKCIKYELKGPRPRGRPKRIWREVVKKDCQARKLNTEDAIDHSKWRKLIKDVRWSGWVWVGECFFWYRPTRVVPDKRPLNSCACVC